jgi:hypothetical protein
LAGSTAGTAKDVVDALRKDGQKVGLLKINLFRPFPIEEVLAVIRNVKNLAIMERTISSGTFPPIYNDIIAGLYRAGENKPVQSIVYGLGGRDIFAKDIQRVFENLLQGKNTRQVEYIGMKEVDSMKKNQQIQEVLAEYTRRMDVLRSQQAEIVREFREKKEKKQREEIMNNLNS